MKILLSFFAVFGFYFVVFCQTTDPTTPASTNDTNLNPNVSYCFEFTWVGPEYYKEAMFNRTCADYLDETRAQNVPCSPPIVVTYDGSPPDIDFLFQNHMPSVLCKRTDSQVCASYTYSFDGRVNNATFMCTKVQNMMGGGAITSGCYTQEVDGYKVEMCVCKSTTGLYKPCNGKLVTW